MLTESIYNDLSGIEHLSVRKRDENGGGSMYALYKIFLSNDLMNIFEMLTNAKKTESDDDIDNINISDYVKNKYYEFQRQLEEEYKGLSSSAGPSSMYKLLKIKKELVNKSKTYIDIINTIATINKKNKKVFVEEMKINSNNLTVTKLEFRKTIETIIVYLKQNLLNFFNIYTSYIGDLKKYQDELFKTTEELYK